MKRSYYEIIMDWPYHPQMVLMLAALSVIVLGWHSGPLWGVLVTSALLSPIVAAVLFVPYLAFNLALVAGLSLLRAILSALRHPGPKAP